MTEDRTTDPEISPPREHDWAIRCAFVEATRVPASCRPAHLATLPEAIAEEVRALLRLVSEDEVAEASVDHWFGRRLGRWTLGVELGRGGHGRVFRGSDGEGGSCSASLAAIKMLEGSGEDLQERLDREVATIAVLDHPGIVRVLDHGIVTDSTGSVAFLGMELVEGGEPILDWAIRVRPDLDARLELIDRLLDALAHAHARGVVHRDLKSSNVLIDDTGSPRIIDFGIARILDEAGHGVGLHATGTRDRHTIVGSLAHLAPEQVDRRLGPVSPATDVHAVGLLAYRLLCGEPPYDASGSVVQSIQAVLHVPPADPAIFAPVLPRAICDWLLACLAKDPSARPADAADARELLDHARTSGGFTAPSPNHKPGHATGGGHGQRVAVAIVATTAAIVGGVIMFPTDPNTQVTSNEGAGESEMRIDSFLGSVVGGAIVSGVACGQDYSDAVMASDPIAYWRMDINDGFVRNMVDGSPLAAIVGVPAMSDSPVGCADDLSIDTTGGTHLNAGEDDRFDLSSTSSMSVETWIRRSGEINQPAFILSQGRDIVTGGWDLLVYQGDIGLSFRVNVIGPGVTSSTTIDVDRWIHVVGVIDDERRVMSLYIDGVLESEAEGGNPRVSSDYPLLIGRHNARGPWIWPFNGSIDEVAIYHRALSPEEIAAHYAAADPDKRCTPACIGNFTQDEIVDAADLGILLAVWGDAAAYPEADLNQDGNINAADLGMLLSAWGPCPE